MFAYVSIITLSYAGLIHLWKPPEAVHAIIMSHTSGVLHGWGGGGGSLHVAC